MATALRRPTPSVAPIDNGAAQIVGRGLMVEDKDQHRQPGPSGLVAGAEACAIIALKIFVKEQQVSPVPIVLKSL